MRYISLPKLAFLFLAAFCGVSHAASTCTVNYSTRNDWSNGFVVDVVVANSGTAAVTGWKVEWKYGTSVKLASAPWGARVKIAGGAVTATDDGSQPTIAPGGKISFGMPLSYSGSAKPEPVSLTVSGKGCATVAPQTLFYVDPDSNAANWVRNNSWDNRAPAIRDHIANQPAGKWFGGWSGDIGPAVANYVSAAAARDQMPILVAYNIPGRDCGQYSSGGAESIQGYQTWIGAFAAAVGSRKAVVILEPDALPQLDCLTDEGRNARLQMLQYAVGQFKEKAPNAYLYLDAGNSTWLQPSVAASRLLAAGIVHARGFSLNVSNYKTTADSLAYGDAINAALAQQQGITKTFVVDTSRNGNGPYGTEWCDPPGRKLGAPSKHFLGGEKPEMTLWIKNPGDADGCAAPAGTFVPDLAYKLVFGYY